MEKKILEFKKKINAHRLHFYDIEKLLDLSPQTLRKKINNPDLFTVGEIKLLETINIKLD